MRYVRLTTLAAVTALAALTLVLFSPRLLQDTHSQGYSGALPNVSAATGTSLRAPYTAGTITYGGATQSITADATGVLTTASQSSCAAPGYTACNFIYWPGSGTALLSTTTYATAFASGNVVVAFITTNGTDILTIVPASWNVATFAGGLSGGGAYTDGAYWVPAAACVGGASANTSGLNGLTTTGADGTPVMQVSTSNSGTNSHFYTCDITPPTRLTTGRGATITSVDFFYSTQNILGTQAATLASGLMNSTTVFSAITYPTPAASETVSQIVKVRADTGTLTITPAVASFNVTTATAGAFYSATFTPEGGIAAETNWKQLFLKVTLLNTASLATVTTSPGALVHYSKVN